MLILGIDPGPKKSAYLTWDKESQAIFQFGFGILPNDEFVRTIKSPNHSVGKECIPVIEMVQSFGMPVGKEVFETVLFIGRLVEIFDGMAKLVYRKDIKIHFCETNRANDANIRRALIDRFGEPGTKKAAGKLYGVKKDIWSALACAVWYGDTHPG